jgi:hypothetical protein
MAETLSALLWYDSELACKGGFMDLSPMFISYEGMRRFGIGKIKSMNLFKAWFRSFCRLIKVFFLPYYQDSRRSFNPQTDLLSTDLNNLNFYVVSKNHSLVYLSCKD